MAIRTNQAKAEIETWLKKSSPFAQQQQANGGTLPEEVATNMISIGISGNALMQRLEAANSIHYMTSQTKTISTSGFRSHMSRANIPSGEKLTADVGKGLEWEPKRTLILNKYRAIRRMHLDETDFAAPGQAGYEEHFEREMSLKIASEIEQLGLASNTALAASTDDRAKDFGAQNGWFNRISPVVDNANAGPSNGMFLEALKNIPVELASDNQGMMHFMGKNNTLTYSGNLTERQTQLGDQQIAGGRSLDVYGGNQPIIVTPAFETALDTAYYANDGELANSALTTSPTNLLLGLSPQNMSYHIYFDDELEEIRYTIRYYAAFEVQNPFYGCRIENIR